MPLDSFEYYLEEERRRLRKDRTRRYPFERNPFEHKTYEEFLESCNFDKGYCTFQKSFSYVGKGNNVWADFGYSDFVRHKDELIKNGYHILEVDESDNFFRDDLVSYIYLPDRIGDFRMKKAEGYFPMLMCIGIGVFFVAMMILIAIYA